MKSPAPTITLLCLLFLASCITRNNTSLEAFNQDVYTPEYASGFKILGAENAASTLIQILIRKKISGCSRVAKIGLIISLFLFSLEFSSDLFLFDVSLPQKFWCHSSDATEEW